MAEDHGSHGRLTFKTASYNKWNERDQLDFTKEALSGNAAQVLWDTDSTTTDSLKKLLKILKSRYNGERQADKYRAELQIRRRKPNESLSDLHQDIRRLMALAYPKLTAQAHEELACDHFINALSDLDFALKVKKKLQRPWTGQCSAYRSSIRSLGEEC